MGDSPDFSSEVGEDEGEDEGEPLIKPLSGFDHFLIKKYIKKEDNA